MCPKQETLTIKWLYFKYFAVQISGYQYTVAWTQHCPKPQLRNICGCSARNNIYVWGM